MVKLCNLRLGNDFLDMTPEAQSAKEKKKRKWNSSKLNFSASKNSIKIVKRQSMEWEKIVTNHRSIRV